MTTSVPLMNNSKRWMILSKVWIIKTWKTCERMQSNPGLFKNLTKSTTTVCNALKVSKMNSTNINNKSVNSALTARKI